MLSNYIKNLILSTIVLVIGNNSNYCYSMENVYKIDQYGIRRTVNGWAILDKDENGNIIENNHFFEDGSYLRMECLNLKRELLNNNANDMHIQQIIQNISDHFYSVCQIICGAFCSIGRVLATK